jgi:RNA 3'-terminal phosphate cyclase-like protein
MVLSLMCLGSEDVGKLRVAELGEEWLVYHASYLLSLLNEDDSIQTLRDLRDFFGVKFKITPAPADPGQEKEKNQEKILSCFGIGYININRSLA